MEKNTPRQAGSYWLHVGTMFAIAFAAGALRTPMHDGYWIYQVIGYAIGVAFLPALALVLLARRSHEPERIYRNCWIAFAIFLLGALYGAMR